MKVLFIAKDFFHPHVRIALEQDGRIITDDPYYLIIDERHHG